MQTAKMPLVINSMIVMPIATQNSIKPIILFILTPICAFFSTYNQDELIPSVILAVIGNHFITV